MIELVDADVYYGNAQALYQVSFRVTPGQVVALMGRNGAGKSTALKALAGWLPCRRGSLLAAKKPVARATPELLSKLGVALVPEDRQIFSNLTVEENLKVATVAHPKGRWSEADIWRLFPGLHKRQRARGGALSGGERQMLSIGRALLCQPDALLLDEPTEGLAPVVVNALTEAIRMIADAGVGIALVEQNAKVPRKVASEFLVFDGGRIVWAGDRELLEREAPTVQRLLSV